MAANLLSRSASALAAHARFLQIKLALFMLAGKGDTLSFRRGGTYWHAPVRDRYITPALLAGGGYQQAELDGLVRWLRWRGLLSGPGSVIVDVGANIGTSSIPLARATGLSVLAVEPAPDNLALLRRNVDDNGLSGRVVCIQAAIATRRGDVCLALDPTNCGGHEIDDFLDPAISVRPSGRSEIAVPAMPLETIVERGGSSPDRVALVWSDTQGCEQQVIETGARLWKAGVPLFIEVWPAGLRRHGGVAGLLGAADRHFRAVVMADDLRTRGPWAVERPLTALASVIPRLRGALGATNALLLPRQSR